MMKGSDAAGRAMSPEWRSTYDVARNKPAIQEGENRRSRGTVCSERVVGSLKGSWVEIYEFVCLWTFEPVATMDV